MRVCNYHFLFKVFHTRSLAKLYLNLKTLGGEFDRDTVTHDK